MSLSSERSRTKKGRLVCVQASAQSHRCVTVGETGPSIRGGTLAAAASDRIIPSLGADGPTGPSWAQSWAGERLPAGIFGRVSGRRMLVRFQLILSFPVTLLQVTQRGADPNLCQQVQEER